MKKLLLIALAIIFNGITFAQTAQVVITVDWPQWSTENKVELYSPDNILLQTIDNGYDGSGGATNPYNEITTPIDYLVNASTTSGYYVIVYDTYGDGWNGNGTVNITADGVSALFFDGNFDTSGTNTEITQTIYFSIQNPTPPMPGDSIFDTSGKNYIEYIKGNLPIIISAPHGGVQQSGQTIGGVFYPDNDAALPDRNCGTVERDDNTEILVREIQEEIFALTGCYAHVIISNLHRSKLDPNRLIAEGACGDADAEFYWNAFHDFIDDASADVETNWGKGLYIDLHGQSHSIARVELGYNITSNQLNNSDLNTITGTSITSLVANNLNSLNQEQLVRGPQSLGSLLKDTTAAFYNANVDPGCGINSGYRALPSDFDTGTSNTCDDTRPFTNNYFNGDYYNNERHGSGQSADDGLGGGGSIDGIMSEVNRRVRDLGTYKGNVYDTRPQTLVPFAQDYATVLLDYINIHYNDFTDFNYDATVYETTDADPVPIIAGVSGGIFSSTAGLMIDANTGIIDVSGSTMGNYVVTYEAGACAYYSSTQNVEITESTLGLDSLENATFKLYPNPTKELINYESNRKVSEVKIFNLLGQEMASKKTNATQATIDFSTLATGSYLLSFYIEDKLASSKLVVKN